MSGFTEDDRGTTISLNSGSVAYDLADARPVDIGDLISSLEEAKDDGATHVVLASGNHRGAKWQRLVGDWDWVD